MSDQGRIRLALVACSTPRVRTDIAAYPWIAVSDWTTLDLADYANLTRWYQAIGKRPAVTRGMALPWVGGP